MTEPAGTALPPDEAALRAEIARLNKIITSLMNRAERDMGAKGSAFSMFQNAVTLENQIRERTQALETAFRENERINRALQREKEEQHALILKLEEAHNQLLQSEKLASIGQLAAGVAHEINNPIGFVNSNLGTLKNYVGQLLNLIDDALLTVEPLLAGDPAIKERLEELHRKADLDFLREDIGSLITESIDGTARVRRIVQDLRDFSRTGEVDLEWVDLHAGLESTLNVVANEIKYKAEVVREYGTLPQVECRPSQINQVFMNLLVNAAQAISRQGKITLRSGCAADKVWIAIGDTGSGISPEIVDRIFDPFFTTKPVGKGTGLGLSVSYGIVEKHGGKIEVASELGRGTTFTVWLPIRQIEAVPLA
ncbi:ATP-binding protein [Dechloromonas denitrificans]|uniref:ATP-binding protein n=1 Tax=Dechloromonas denitrificans TaxID=281362 RepID=UPI001CF8326E|nr:ATP-binding protein [Dechloromonas denitrificans]UCV04850.1 histidine kinase [Dechloromonas denitrificans]